MNGIKTCFQFFAGHIGVQQFDKHQVIVCSAGNQVDVAGEKFFAQNLCIQDDLMLISFEVFCKGFAESNRFGGNDMHQRTALCAREDSFVDLRTEFFGTENHASARSAERFMGRSRGHIGIRDR